MCADHTPPAYTNHELNIRRGIKGFGKPMAFERAKALLEDLQRETPWHHRLEFLNAILAHKSVYKDEVAKPSKKSMLCGRLSSRQQN